MLTEVLPRHRTFQLLSPECLVIEGLGPMRCHNGHAVTQQLFHFSTLVLSSYRGFPGSSAVKNPPANTGDGFLGQEVLLEKKMATHSSIIAWKIPWTEEPGRLQVHGVMKESDTA